MRRKKDLPEFIKINRNFSSSVGFNRVKATNSKRPSKVLNKMADTISGTKDQEKEPKMDFARCWASIDLGRGESGRIWFDIETKKVLAPEDWLYRRRWQPFMVSVVRSVGGEMTLEVWASDDEELLIESLNELFREEGPKELAFDATREFDKMVLAGRFTNARRAFSSCPGSWPHLEENDFRWTNLRRVLLPSPARRADCLSRDVPELWANGKESIVSLHCARDSADLALRDPESNLSNEVRANLEMVLSEVKFEKRWLMLGDL